MTVIRKSAELRRKLQTRGGKSVGLVPTMGFLHEGHLSLVKKCKESVDITVVSIFVNPTQFGPNEDYESYPRDEDRDISMLQKAGADIVFIPTPEEIYPPGNVTNIIVEAPITGKLCAKTRPTHFDGVTNVVSRLFCLVKPDKAFFGRKDAQQLAIIQRMAQDLLIGTEIVGCPIVREDDGLALSSRNTYLSEKERMQALSISKSLFAAERRISEMADSGFAEVEEIKNQVKSDIESAGGRVDYVELVDPFLLDDLDNLEGDYLLAVAAYFGTTRLIDNRARIQGQCI